MNIVAYPSPSGSAIWRLDDPAKYLRKRGIDYRIDLEGISQEAIEWADIIVLQNCVDIAGLDYIREMQVTKGKKIVVECDDYHQLNPENPYSKVHEVTHYSEIIEHTIEIADLVTCTTNYLADKIRKINPKVAVLPNAMDMDRWDLPKHKNTSNKVRIGWAGSMTHIKDLEILVNPLKRIHAEYPNVQFIFVGDERVVELFKGVPIEMVTGVPFEAWPSRLHGLRLDIGLAPLCDNEFNRCKSNIKWQEYSIAEIAGIYSTIVYNHPKFEPNLGLIAYDEEQWYRCIKNLINHPEMRQDIAIAANQMVKRKFNLAKNIGKWEEAFQSIML